jgi:hypothetical protein
MKATRNTASPTIGSLGITDASQIGVLFNATEPMGDSVSVLDVTLKFYGSDGSFLGAIDGQQTSRTATLATASRGSRSWSIRRSRRS